MTRSVQHLSRRARVVAAAFTVTAAAMANPVLAEQPVSRNFEGNAPAIGEMMPDVVVHSRDGAELRLRDLLEERYTVLILGCLT